jgi:hypothetical protein
VIRDQTRPGSIGRALFQYRHGILSSMFTKLCLQKLYIKEQKSVSQIAKLFNCSENKVNYWLKKFEIKKRTISEAVYIQNNPNGDPFKFRLPHNDEEWMLYGLGIGLYWGEGNKMNNHAVRLGNTDPDLLKKFLQFLHTFYKIDSSRLRFGLQIFTDIDPDSAKLHWSEKLSIPPAQFQKITVSKSLHKNGTYRKKSQYGVLTIYFSNMKLRDSIVGAIEELRK